MRMMRILRRGLTGTILVTSSVIADEARMEHVLVTLPIHQTATETSLPVTVLTGDELARVAAATIGGVINVLDNRIPTSMPEQTRVGVITRLLLSRSLQTALRSCEVPPRCFMAAGLSAVSLTYWIIESPRRCPNRHALVLITGTPAPAEVAMAPFE